MGDDAQPLHRADRSKGRFAPSDLPLKSYVRALELQMPMPAPTVRAAGVVLRGSQVLLHRRLGEQVWALPGGRVESGESTGEALVCEFQEELGCAATCRRLVYVAENLFSHGGALVHEVGLYFQVDLEATSPAMAELTSFRGVERQLEFRWFERGSLAGVNVRPAFLVAALAKAELEFQHVVEREAASL